jgi:hypothetical protein
MRSVFIHLWDTTEADVAATLDSMCTPDRDGRWLLLVGEDDPCLYVCFYRDGPREVERWTERFASQGGPPTVIVGVDISGRHDGWPQARAFVAGLPARQRGVATDDDRGRLWTRGEVTEDQAPKG